MSRRFEWDFSSCPDDELRECHEYEYARERRDVCEAVKRYRQARPHWSFEDCIDPAALMEMGTGVACAFYPEFPATPYLAIPAAIRRERRHFMGKETSRYHSIAASFARALQDMDGVEFCGTAFDLPENNATLAALCIDWTRSNNELVAQFREWLATHRYRKENEARGAGALSRQLEKELKCLSALRLLREMPWGKAFEGTHKTLKTGKGLFSCNAGVWQRAKKGAEKIVNG